MNRRRRGIADYHSVMVFGYFVVAIIAAAVVVFAFQNTTQVSIRFITWMLPSTSIAAVTLVALASGVVATGVPLWIARWRLGRRVRTLETQVRQLETSLADRDRALLDRPPTSGPR